MPENHGFVALAHGGSSTPVRHGGSFSFTAEPNDPEMRGYLFVYANGIRLHRDAHGIFNIDNITTSIHIDVAFVLSVIFPDSDRYIITPYGDSSLPVARGGNFSFMVELSYEYSHSDFFVWANGVRVHPNAYGVFTIYDITEHVYVTFTNIFRNTFVVELGEGHGYSIVSINGNAFAEHDGYFQFRLNIHDGFEASDIIVKVNGEIVIPDENGIFTVWNVTEDLVITVHGNIRELPAIPPSNGGLPLGVILGLIGAAAIMVVSGLVWFLITKHKKKKREEFA